MLQEIERHVLPQGDGTFLGLGNVTCISWNGFQILASKVSMGQLALENVKKRFLVVGEGVSCLRHKTKLQECSKQKNLSGMPTKFPSREQQDKVQRVKCCMEFADPLQPRPVTPHPHHNVPGPVLTHGCIWQEQRHFRLSWQVVSPLILPWGGRDSHRSQALLQCEPVRRRNKKGARRIATKRAYSGDQEPRFPSRPHLQSI